MRAQTSERHFIESLRRNVFSAVERVLESYGAIGCQVPEQLGSSVIRSRYVFIRTGKLFDKFIGQFALCYRRGNRLLVTRDDFLRALNQLEICSAFKFRGRKWRRCKRCKIVVRRVRNHEFSKYNDESKK